MKIYKVMVGTDQGTILMVDAIEWQSKLWLVPMWLDNPALKVTSPNRIVRVDNLPHQKISREAFGHDYLLNTPVPMALLDQKTPAQPISGFEYVELPDIHFELPERRRDS